MPTNKIERKRRRGIDGRLRRANPQAGLKVRFEFHGEDEIGVIGRSGFGFAEKPWRYVLKQ
jgi:hypothetical protein